MRKQNLTGYIIRRYKFQDLQQIIKICNCVSKENSKVREQDFLRCFKRIDLCLDPQKDVFVAEVEGKIIGFAQLYIRDEFFNMFFPLVPEDTDAKITREFIELLEQEAVSRQWKYLQVEVRGEDNFRRELLENIGFRIVRYFWELQLSPLEISKHKSFNKNYYLVPFRRGKDEDILRYIINRSFKENWGYFDTSKADLENWLISERSSPENIRFIKKQSGEVIGFYDWSPQGKKGFLNNIAVLPEYQGQGIGRYFLNECLVHMKNNGMELASLEVDGKNVGAIEIYQKAGFIVKRVDFYMRKDLH